MSRLFPNAKSAAEIAAQELREEDAPKRSKNWPEWEYVYIGHGDYTVREIPNPRFLWVRRQLFRGVFA